MKLAEALALRSDAQKQYLQLRARAQATARYQEGEVPAEDAAVLLAEADRALETLEDLIRRINRTNAVADLSPGTTLTDALARRDVLRLRHALFTNVADAGAGAGTAGGRQMRSELRVLSAVPVDELRTTADDIAKQLREVDLRIQEKNWEVELLD
jgi:hypothetical protein